MCSLKWFTFLPCYCASHGWDVTGTFPMVLVWFIKCNSTIIFDLEWPWEAKFKVTPPWSYWNTEKKSRNLYDTSILQWSTCRRILHWKPNCIWPWMTMNGQGKGQSNPVLKSQLHELELNFENLEPLVLWSLYIHLNLHIKAKSSGKLCT